jgi:hypothetical protein
MGWPGQRVPLDYPSQQPKHHGPPVLEERPQESRHKTLWTIIVVVIIAGAGVGLVWDAHAVNVKAVLITSGDEACGLAGQSEGGFVAALGALVSEAIVINGRSCTIDTAYATTSGFSVEQADTPESFGSVPLGNVFSFQVETPYHLYTGVLTIDVE